MEAEVTCDEIAILKEGLLHLAVARLEEAMCWGVGESGEDLAVRHGQVHDALMLLVVLEDRAREAARADLVQRVQAKFPPRLPPKRSGRARREA